MEKKFKYLKQFESFSNDTKEEILKVIDDLEKDAHFHIFNNREDFVDTRTDWNSLADTAERLYWALEQIKDIVNKN